MRAEVRCCTRQGRLHEPSRIEPCPAMPAPDPPLHAHVGLAQPLHMRILHKYYKYLQYQRYVLNSLNSPQLEKFAGGSDLVVLTCDSFLGLI